LAQCNKSFDGWGFATDPNGELIALPRPPAIFRDLLPRKEEKGQEEKVKVKRHGYTFLC